jgi:phenylalanyl-tRNA synthetase beta chain
MNISVNWLKEFIELNASIPELIEMLNNIGLLVDSWETQGDDTILELEIYANRPDTTGHYGVARELAAAFSYPLKKLNWAVDEVEEETSSVVDVQIYDDDLCPRYTGMVVKDVLVGPSPDWLKKRIESMGLKSVNNVVDITNYVLFSTAQPIHAFDLKKLSGNKVIVRRAQKGESLRSLEGKDISLSPEMLVIADEKKPVALAGVIGGEESAVTEETRDVFIESAYFDPVSVRKTGKTALVQTDASYRFERGADISYPPQAALMAASLLSQFGGKVTKGIVDVYPKPRKQKTVLLRHHRVTELLGVEIEDDFIRETLSGLEFHVELQQEGIWQVKVPFFRVDIEREADLIEEIARFYGYDKIPAQLPPIRELEPLSSPKRIVIERIRQILLSHGLDEVVNLSFSDLEEEVSFKGTQKAIQIRNPISSRAAYMRTTLLGGLLQNIAWNKNRGAEGIHIFEIGNVYFWKEEKCQERSSLCMMSIGDLGYGHWQAKNERTDFFHLKGISEDLLIYLRYKPFSFSEKSHDFFEQDFSLSLNHKGEEIGNLGLLRKEICEPYSIKEDVWAACIDLSTLLDRQAFSFQYTPVIKFPSISRDLAFVGDNKIPFSQVKEEIEKLEIPFLEKLVLSDRFAGKSIPEGKVSLLFRFVFRHPQRTLVASEVDSMQQKVIKVLGNKFGFQLREGG